MKKSLFSTAEYYKPYVYKGLRGRYMHMPAKNPEARRTFVVLYGQHATLERVEPVVEALTEFGDVYAADYPGFGGMDPSFKLKQYPSLHFYADYIKQFIDEIIPENRKLTLLGISYGFQLFTETLNQHPELNERVEEVVSFVGFVHHEDFHFPPSYSIPLLYLIANVGRTWLGSKIVGAFMQGWFIAIIYKLTKPIQAKYKSLSAEETKGFMEGQIWLWRINDIRTHAATGWDFCMKTDLTNYRVNAPLTHVGVPKDHLLNNERVVKELSEMFTPFESLELHLENHAPLDLDSREKVLALFPSALHSKFKRSHNEKAVL